MLGEESDFVTVVKSLENVETLEHRIELRSEDPRKISGHVLRDVDGDRLRGDWCVSRRILGETLEKSSGRRAGENAIPLLLAGGCSDFQADDYFMESSEVQSYVCLLSAVTLSLFNVVLTAARFYKSK